MAIRLLFLIGFNYVVLRSNAFSQLIKKQSSLTTELFETRNYDPKVRPSRLYSDTVFVKFKLYFNQILDVVSNVMAMMIQLNYSE